MKVVFLLAVIISVFATKSAGPTGGPTPDPHLGLSFGLGPFRFGIGAGHRYRPYYGDYGGYYDRPYRPYYGLRRRPYF